MPTRSLWKVKGLLHCADSASQAVHLFSALRELDEIGAAKVYAMMPSTEGVGLAVYNRLLRSAGFRVINI